MILGAIIKLSLSSDVAGNPLNRKDYTLHVEIDYYKYSGELTGIAFDVQGYEIHDFVDKITKSIPYGTLANEIAEAIIPWIINYTSDVNGVSQFIEYDFTFDTDLGLDIPIWFNSRTYDDDIEEAVVSITGTELMVNKSIIDSVPVTSLSSAAALAAVVFAVPAVVYLVANKFKD